MSGKELGQQPAFPIVSTQESDSEMHHHHSIGNVRSSGGMTLRTHMLVEFSASILANPALIENTAKQVVQIAEEQADALLEQLAKEQP